MKIEGKLRERIIRQLSQPDPYAYRDNALRKPVAGLDSPKPEQERRKIKAGRMERSKKSVAIVVTIVSYRRRRLDGFDNLRFAHKPLVDRITETLGFASDDDPRLRFECEQVITEGKTGTQVLITEL